MNDSLNAIFRALGLQSSRLNNWHSAHTIYSRSITSVHDRRIEVEGYIDSGHVLLTIAAPTHKEYNTRLMQLLKSEQTEQLVMRPLLTESLTTQSEGMEHNYELIFMPFMLTMDQMVRDRSNDTIRSLMRQTLECTTAATESCITDIALTPNTLRVDQNGNVKICFLPHSSRPTLPSALRTLVSLYVLGCINLTEHRVALNDIYRLTGDKTQLNRLLAVAGFYGITGLKEATEILLDRTQEQPAIIAAELITTTAFKPFELLINILTLTIPHTDSISVQPAKHGNDNSLKIDFDRCTELGLAGDGLLPYRRGKKWGYASFDGTRVIEERFEVANSFCGGRASVMIDKEWGLIDTTGRMIIPPCCRQLMWWGEWQVAVVCTEQRWWLKDAEGNTLNNQPYDYIGCMSEGVAAVRKDERWGYIDCKGKQLTDLVFDRAYSLHNGTAEVVKGLRRFTINRNGCELLTVEIERQEN